MEPRNEVKHEEEIVPGVTLGQLIKIHDEFSTGKREGEITIAEYSEAVGISYDKSKIELQEAERKGLMKCRKVGKRSYYSFP